MITGEFSTSDNEENQPGANSSAVPLWKRSFIGWYPPSLALILLLAICLNFWHLGQSGYSNTYYAAGVRSMMINFHNFFFVSYDPNGFVSLDKPPVDFWLQVLSAKMFGFSPFSLLFPQALAGVLSVALLAHLIRRNFGKLAGLLAALALTLTPISVITSRNNDVDSMLVLVVLLATWAVIIAVERGSLRWLLLSMGLVGLGFNIKAAEVYLVIPAFVLLYFLTAPRRWDTRIWHLAFAMVVLLVVSLSWAVAVDLVPSAQRPYVGSSRNNTELRLVLGYNGVKRLSGIFSDGTRKIPLSPLFRGKAAPPNPFPFRGGEAGFPGLTRLFNNQVAGQISWLLPLALIGIIVLLWRIRPDARRDDHFEGLVLWGTWFLTAGAFFSFILSYHMYYMVMFAPALCALVGIGIATLWHEYTNHTRGAFLFPSALLITAIFQLDFLSPFPAWRNSDLPPIIFVVVLIVAFVLLSLHLLEKANFSSLSTLLSTAGMLALLLAPTLWTVIPIIEKYNSSFPIAGPYGTTTPSLASAQLLMTNPTRNEIFASSALSTADLQLLHFLAKHESSASYLYATTSSSYSASTIIETGRGVMTMGGFSGADRILTRDRLIDLTRRGIVHYFLLPGTIPFALRDITHWIQSVSQRVPYSAWYSGRSFPVGTRIAGLRLYEYMGLQPKSHHRHSRHTHLAKH